METSEAKKTVKPSSKKSNTAAVRVTQETRKRLLAELSKINKKSFGKRVKLDALLLKLLPRLTAQDVTELQDASLTGRDRMEQAYRAHCAKFGQLTMDEYLSLLLKSESSKISDGNAAVS
jgi:hypothetical protein